MKTYRFFDSRVGSLSAAALIMLGMLAPATLMSSVGAAQLTDRQISMSDTRASATDVKYQVTFTPVATAGVVVIEFCGTSPVITETCTAPAGFSASGATVDGGNTIAAGYSGSTASVKVTTSMTAGTPKTFELSGLTNPNYVTTSSTGFYARLITYTDATQSNNYTALGTYGTHIDDGGIALSTTNPIQVSAVIRETMTFCVNKTAPTSACGGVSSPINVSLGHGNPAALDSTATDTDTAYSQISTNASGGAIVYMKNSNTCGGLYRAGASAGTCDIPPVGSGNDAIAFGTAKFGMRLGTPAVAGTGSGSITRVADYSTSSNYGMNWVSGNATGVSSTYGDAIYNSGGAPVSNQNVPMTFAATASPNTPAGSYSASMNLIAVGKF